MVLSPIRGGYIPPKGWFYPPKGVVLSPIKVGIKPPGVVLRVVLSPIWGWFYARDQKTGTGGGWSKKDARRANAPPWSRITMCAKYITPYAWMNGTNVAMWWCVAHSTSLPWSMLALLKAIARFGSFRCWAKKFYPPLSGLGFGNECFQHCSSYVVVVNNRGHMIFGPGCFGPYALPSYIAVHLNLGFWGHLGNCHGCWEHRMPMIRPVPECRVAGGPGNLGPWNRI